MNQIQDPHLGFPMLYWPPRIMATPELQLIQGKVNKAIKNTNLPIPKVEDIKAKMAGNKVFSKLDLHSAFHQLHLAEES